MGYVSIIQLATFMAVIEEGTMTGAARRLCYSQPAVSGHIRGLELTVGTPLLRRGPGPLAATEAGDRLLLLAPLLLQIAEQIQHVGALRSPRSARERTLKASPGIEFS
ncbi:helix-turn-helix domain-containing protein [Knoellia sinensis]|uniref:helix-turn-helix domain-containing protein n=1 Tax=Knoellia sinensis TaxID=136100 RepID=UPI000A0340C5|nr:LysR family transcriptional regulator [Knoellia sinensis]